MRNRSHLSRFVIASLLAVSLSIDSGIAVEPGLTTAPPSLRFQAPVPERPKFSYLGAIDFGSKDLLPTVTYRLGSQTNLFGVKGFDIDVLAVAGASSDNGMGTGGFAAAKSFPLSHESSGIFGLIVRTQSGQKPHGGLLLGISGSLGN